MYRFCSSGQVNMKKKNNGRRDVFVEERVPAL